MKNNRSIKIFSLVVFLIIGTTILFYVTTVRPHSQDGEESSNVDPSLPEVIVSMDSKGFTPSTIYIKVGQKVTWINNESKDRWPAADIHPTHSLYPGSSITKCGTEEERYIFDACKGVKQGESYSFVFSNEGEWEYHDHLQSRLLGKVIVTQ